MLEDYNSTFKQGHWSSLWHVHIAVHNSSDFRHLHWRVVHCFLQAHLIISRQLSGIGFCDIRMGCSPESPSFHPKEAQVWHSEHFSKPLPGSVLSADGSGAHRLSAALLLVYLSWRKVYALLHQQSLFYTHHIFCRQKPLKIFESPPWDHQFRGCWAIDGAFSRLSMMYFWCDLQCMMWYHNQLVHEMLQGLVRNPLAVC